MLRLASRIELGLGAELDRSLVVCSRGNFWGNAPRNSTRTAALSSPRAEAAATALRVAAGLASRRAEALAAAMTSQRPEIVALMAALAVAAASEREKAIWRRARACSPVLAGLLRARAAELLTAAAAEVLAEHFPEHFCELAAARLRLERTADFASGS
jgi:hypothetical protein